jgi:hypothetical protein
MTKLRITLDGRIRGLWDDDVSLAELGVIRVRRASHVEFDNRLQRWTVRPAIQPSMHRCPAVHQSPSRAHALAWEHENFQPGGPYWHQLTDYFGDESDRSPSTF